MKLLILGYEDYLTNLLFYLNDSPFLKENDVDFIIGTHPPVNKKKLIKRYFKKLNLNRIIYWFNLKIYSEKFNSIKSLLFPLKDISYINTYKRVRQLDYNGLNSIENLEQYDFLIITTFGEKIPVDILEKPKYGTLNIHPSFLPLLRGGYPTYVEAYKNTEYSGTTVHFMSEEYDAGDIMIQKKYPAEKNSTNADRYMKSSQVAAELLNVFNSKQFVFDRIPQDKNQVTVCRKILKYKSELELMSEGDDLSGYLRANYARHLMPFTHTRYGLFLLGIISADKHDRTDIIPSKYSQKKKNFVFVSDKKFFLKFFGEFFYLKKFIYKGQLIEQ